MHFVNNGIRNALHLRTLVIFPACWIRLFHIDDRGTMAVDADGLGKDAGTFGPPFAILLDAEGVETTFQVFFDNGLPKTFGLALHFQSLEGFATFAFCIDSQDNAVCIRAPQHEGAFFGVIREFVDLFHRYRIIIY